jgi:hypothetical protein
VSQALPEEWFVRDDRLNAGIAWVLTALLAGTAVANFLVGSFVTMAIAALAAAVALVPALAHRSWTRTVPWPMLLLASLPLAIGAFSPSFFGDTIFALGVAALALLLVVALQMTTTVRMTPNFAIGFVVISTLGTAGLWAIGSAASARYFGTRFVQTNEQLMIVFTAALVASVVSAVAFRWYFRRQLQANLEGDAGKEAQAA